MAFSIFEGDFMAWFGTLFTKSRKSDKNDEIDMREERKRIQIEHEKAVYDEKLKTIQRQQELERVKLDYQIKEQQCKIDEEFSDYPDGFEEAIEEHTEDVPSWLAPYVAPLLGKLLNQGQGPTPPPTINSSSGSNTSGDGPLTLNDDELRAIVQAMDPMQRKQAQKMEDGQIKSLVRMKYPKITDECLERAIKILKS